MVMCTFLGNTTFRMHMVTIVLLYLYNEQKDKGFMDSCHKSATAKISLSEKELFMYSHIHVNANLDIEML